MKILDIIQSNWFYYGIVFFFVVIFYIIKIIVSFGKSTLQIAKSAFDTVNNPGQSISNKNIDIASLIPNYKLSDYDNSELTKLFDECIYTGNSDNQKNLQEEYKHNKIDFYVAVETAIFTEYLVADNIIHSLLDAKSSTKTAYMTKILTNFELKLNDMVSSKYRQITPQDFNNLFVERYAYYNQKFVEFSSANIPKPINEGDAILIVSNIYKKIFNLTTKIIQDDIKNGVFITNYNQVELSQYTYDKTNLFNNIFGFAYDFAKVGIGYMDMCLLEISRAKSS